MTQNDIDPRGKTNFGAFPVTQSPADTRPRWLAIRQAIEDHRDGPLAPVQLREIAFD